MTERPTAALVTESEAEQEKTTWFDLSLFQVLGGALAAMTAAALGSRISVGGTVIGAAVASVIAAVAGAVYTTSLKRTSETVRGMLGRRSGSGSTAMTAPNAKPGTEPEPVSAVGGKNRRRFLVVSSVVGAVMIFALAAGALTLYEVVSGQALSGGGGTTISQVRQADPDNRPTENDPAPASSESSEPEPTAEPSESAEADSEPTAEPSPEPSATSAEPSSTAEAEPSVTAQSEPSATAESPDAAPSQTAE